MIWLDGEEGGTMFRNENQDCRHNKRKEQIDRVVKRKLHIQTATEEGAEMNCLTAKAY